MEFISLQNTMKEAAERLSLQTKHFKARLDEAGKLADAAINELMTELSNFGDAVQSGVNKEKEFYVIWNDVVATLATLPEEEKQKTFDEMETALLTIYTNVLQDERELPASVT